jgi:hypothetical protein
MTLASKNHITILFRKANKISVYYNIDQLSAQLKSNKSDDRLLALLLIRKQANNKPLKAYYSLSKKHIEDSDNNCRWQSLIIIGEYINKYQDDIFNIIIKYGSSEDQDMRMAIATVLLEHLFEKDFKKYFSLYKNISKDNHLLLDTLSSCWVNKNDSKELKSIKKYLDSIKELKK